MIVNLLNLQGIVDPCFPTPGVVIAKLDMYTYSHPPLHIIGVFTTVFKQTTSICLYFISNTSICYFWSWLSVLLY